MNRYSNRFYNFEGFGPAIKNQQPSAEILDKYQGKLPNRLLEYWQEYGFCGWGNGIFWTVNPDDYSDILEEWLQGTSFVNKDNYYVVGRTAFGELFVWGEATGQSIKIVSNYSMFFPRDDSDKIKNDGPDMAVDLYFASKSKDSMEEEDFDEDPLFDRALKLLGPLESDEMYAFVPALALGGSPKLENLQKVKILEHLSFLAQLGEKQVMADIVALSNQLDK